MSLFKKNIYKLVFIVFTLLLTTKPTIAKTYSNTELQNIAVDFIASRLPTLTNGERTIDALPLDDHIKQRSCNSELVMNTANRSYTNRQMTVQIKCLDDNMWHQYIQVRATELSSLVVTQSALAKGEIITQDKLVIEMRPSHLVRSHHIGSVEELIGSRATRSIRAGSSISLNQICAVCKGDKVTIYAKHKTLSIKTNGEALENGLIGENILIENSQSGKKIQAQVTGPNQVIINF
ncbi:flagella basal body P-ring formation protein FlgA [Pseudoalteromonas ulvae UL12]|uniref:Flagella basal body P-ring formation protein FlgA n=1 Tax=Pseudoalteromonas ulvae TaxID=107327 RepID=A0A244CSN0_PSEDV|nr:flagella basal body P-ring formation protein FlgA [Pseudoalteromonas ulvae UL12]OUL58601.1 flagella basal body P-ring formation protein FlgA [Pseudoalteromonas ulvae]